MTARSTGYKILNKGGRTIMFRIVLIISALLSGSALANSDFTYDGKFDASEYDRVFSIDYYTEDGTTKLSGGTLAFADDGTTQYMYISHPLGFKDLSYGCDGEDSQPYCVGWGDEGHGNLGKAIDSEFFTLNFNSGTSSYELKFDMESHDGDNAIDGDGNGDIDRPDVPNGAFTFQTINGSNGESINVHYLSTADYNTYATTGSFNKSMTVSNVFTDATNEFISHSPETVDICDESDSSPECYELADIDANKINGQLIDWVFDLGIEIAFQGDGGSKFFGLLSDLDEALTFGYKDNSFLVSLNALHASPPKLKCTGDGSVKVDDKEPCSAVVTAGRVDVSAPSTIALMGIAIFSLVARRFK